jgi:hypothetical protein
LGCGRIVWQERDNDSSTNLLNTPWLVHVITNNNVVMSFDVLLPLHKGTIASHNVHSPLTTCAFGWFTKLDDPSSCKDCSKFLSSSYGKHEIYFLHNISLYYNNKFAFHMHIFIVSTLILHIFNTTVLWNTIFMVISSNQNLPFIIHYKKLHKQNYNSFHHVLML